MVPQPQGAHKGKRAKAPRMGMDFLPNQVQDGRGPENPNQCCPRPSSVPAFPRSPRGAPVVHVRRVLSGLKPGGDVMSKAARPKSAAPVSLAGS